MTTETASAKAADGLAPDKSKVLLLAEDDRVTRNLLRAGLSALEGYQVILVENGAEALKILQERVVNIVVTDLHMPVMDGFELISIIYERYPQIPVLVMTGLEESLHQNSPMFLGAICILPKPVKLAVLIEQIKGASERAPDGIIQGIPLPSLLQLMEWERKSCTIAVESGQGMGMLYLQEGALVHASFKGLEGLEAAYLILGLSRPRVEFIDVCRVHQTIQLPLTELLLNAAMHSDIEHGHMGSWL
jgi:CheY-like chemotaxis protein